MADDEQLAMLAEGVTGWNDWRRKHPDVGVDLSAADLAEELLMEADLSKANLSGAVLEGADLGGAKLTASNLENARMKGAHLGFARLCGTNLRCADLKGADLTLAELIGADLRRANLEKALLTGAHLHGARLGGASLAGASLLSTDLGGVDLHDVVLDKARVGLAVFVNMDLSNVAGLDMLLHIAPSYVSVDTFYRSKGDISEVFLRGAGVPDEMIAFMHLLRAKAIEFYSCFISYCSKDDDLAKQLHADLQREGVRCWFAPEDLKIGDRFPDKIDEAIRVHDKLLLLLSESSINSAWVRKEVRTALDKERQQNRTVLFPIRLDDAFMDTTEDWADKIRRTRHVGDFRQWEDSDCYQQAFERLLRDLKAG